MAITFEQQARKMGRVMTERAVRARMRPPRTTGESPHYYPDAEAVMHRALVEAQGPLFTLAPVTELGGETLFSSRGLTDWYVAQFSKLNHLK